MVLAIINSRIMDEKIPRLVYVHIPKDCEDCRSLLTFESKQFSKLMKRIMKKLDAGRTEITRQIMQISESGAIITSPYLLEMNTSSNPPGMLIARFDDNAGTTSINQLPYVHLSVRRADVIESTISEADTSNVPSHQYLENRFRQFTERLDSIDSSLGILRSPVGSAQKDTPTPKTALTPKQSPKPWLTPNTSMSTGKILVSPNKATPLCRKRPLSTPQRNPDFVGHLDHTISHVLKRLEKGKQVSGFNQLEQKLVANNLATSFESTLVQNHVESDEVVVKKKRKTKHEHPEQLTSTGGRMYVPLRMGSSSVDLDDMS